MSTQNSRIVYYGMIDISVSDKIAVTEKISMYLTR